MIAQSHTGRPGMVDRRAAVAGEERVELLLDEEAERRKHADAAVRQLRLAVAVHLELRLALKEAGRVEVELRAADRVEVAREAVREGRRLRRAAAAAELGLRDARAGRRVEGEGTGDVVEHL